MNTAWIFDNIKETLVYLRRDDILAIFKDFLSFWDTSWIMYGPNGMMTGICLEIIW